MKQEPKQPPAQFSDFTQDNYETLLRLARQQYRFEPFGTLCTEPHALWRHDIDVSVHRAERCAMIEADLGLRATYFFMLHSRFYNVLELPVLIRARRINALGHWIGLHFDGEFWLSLGASGDLEDCMQKERDLLEDILETSITSISLHNPTVWNGLALNRNSLAGMTNTYGESLRDSYLYVSDSDGYWRFHSLSDVLASGHHSSLHVLTHPEWWQDRDMAPRARIRRSIEGRARATLNAYDQQLAAAGRHNVDDDDGGHQPASLL